MGSGKTTLLLSLARYLVDSSRSGSVYKVVILENEVGREGIDDKLLRGNGFNVENLFNGCACCTLAGELVSAAYEIEKEYAPDWLIVETTGLAYPGLIQDNLSAGIGMESRVCTVVDVSRWKRLMNAMRELFVGQTERADVILMNKTDLAMIHQEHRDIFHILLLGLSVDFDLKKFYDRHLGTYRKHFQEILEKYPEYFC